MDRKEILDYVKKTYKIEPEYLFKGSPDTAALRHREDKKWFGLIMRVPGKSLGFETEEEQEILNVKADPELIGILQTQTGFLPAYHMNKEHWISILLDGAVEIKEIRSLIDGSYGLTNKEKRRNASKNP